ncbi:hypothetical protein LLE49_22890 [Alicyclobacillus tolerans]|uniref:hypothetical protein n=1 Tax=Alicyclobacillus tolerans TaxID=90970 RepID=UPI001F2D8BE7|nr:hypothetical protein [Alicyclobacillus tolerans]MCF8567571.1 hypothetical protein [Alicyclobacillus tolerans]
MIWVSVAFSFSLVIYSIIRKITLREWIVQAAFMVFTLLGSAMVSWSLWPKSDLLLWARWLFEPVTKWFYSIL